MLNSAMSRIAISIFMTLAATWGVDSILAQPQLTGIDDANLFFVYARNIAEGYGYVFTPGYERVEGATSILWTLICALGFVATPTPFSLLLGISIGLCAGAVYVATSVSRSLLAAHGAPRVDTRLVLLLCVVWFAGAPAFYLWNTITLMDSALWTLSVQLLVLFPVCDNLRQFSRPCDRIGLALAVGLASLARPESMALVPGVVFLALACAAPHMGWRAALLHYRAAIATFAGVQGGLVACRLLYFGDPVPNTYFAKVSGDSLHVLRDGFDYLVSFLATHPESIVCLIAALACVGFQGTRILLRRGARDVSATDRAAFIVSAVITAGVSMPLLTGGDHFGSNRLFQPYALFMIVPAANWLLRLLAGRAASWPAVRRAALSLASIALAAGFGAAAWAQFESENQLSHEFFIARHGIATGKAIALAFPDDEPPSIGVVAAGGQAFGHRGRTLDLIGLNWREMAHAPVERQGLRGHSAFNSRVFWSQPPEIMTPRLLQREPKDATDIIFSFEAGVLNQIYSTPRFRRAYVPGSVAAKKGWLSGFFLRSWLERSAADAAVVRVPWLAESRRADPRARSDRGDSDAGRTEALPRAG